MATAAHDSKLSGQGHTYRRFKDGDHEWGNMHDSIFVQDTSHKCLPIFTKRHLAKVAAHRVKTSVVGCKSCAALRSHLLV